MATVFGKTIPLMVGRYHLIEEVGRSTFGPLHLARFEGPNAFQRWSSILEVEERFSRDREFRDAFFQSARTAARIQHPNVVATLDVGETEGMLWLASEYLLGETAKELLTVARHRQMPVPWDIACRIVADAALGLDAIHELTHATTGEPMRLVHGRLAPHRIVVTYDGVTKILEPSAPFVSLSSGDLGQAKMMVGRAVAYSAPELLRGDAFDRRVDIFSLGVVLWELCAGRRLFGGRDESETRAKIHANAVPPLSESVRGFPAEVEALIRQTLAPDPAARMQNAKALARALHQVLVRESLVVTDDEVARYLLHAFPDRLPRKKSRLLTAADVTHVFRRDAILPLDPSGAVPAFPPGPARLPSDTIPDDLPPPLLFRPRESQSPPPSSQAPSASRAPLSTAPMPFAPPGAALPVAASAAAPPPAASSSAAPSPAASSSGAPSPGAPQPSHLSPLGALPPGVPPIGMPPRSPKGGAPNGGAPRSKSPASARVPAPAPAEWDTVPRGPWVGPAILLIVFGVAVAVVAALVVVMVRRSNVVEASAATLPVPLSPPSPAPPPPAPPPSSPPSSAMPPAIPSMSAPPVAKPHAAAPSSSTLPAATSVVLAAPSPVPVPAPAGRGRLTVICDPACDDVFDGKVSLGPSPIYKRPTSPGKHRLTLRIAEPKAEKVVEVDVLADDVTVLKESLGP